MFDFEKLDKTIHEKWRLAIMALLADVSLGWLEKRLSPG